MSETAKRLGLLRAELTRQGVGGFLVPLADQHQSEFPPPQAQRLRWLTGFAGSAGIAAVLMDRAAIFVDGRYTLQVRDQVDTTLFEPRHVTQEPLADWLSSHGAGTRVGFDPWLHTADSIASLKRACDTANITLAALDENPVDAVWSDQPPLPQAPATIYPAEFAGRNAADKRQEIAEAISRNGADAVVLTAPDSIAWLLNIRGDDLSHTPVALAFAILSANSDVQLFIDESKISAAVREHLGQGVEIAAPSRFAGALTVLGQNKKTVQVAPNTASHFVLDRLEEAGAALVRKSDPCELPKATKNSAEIAGIRQAHIRDGAALTRFLAWLSVHAPTGGVDELSAAAKLRSFRENGENFHGLSFDTISGSGPNGAIVHYRAEEATNRPLEDSTLYLVDSGAQYLDGTTDVTRTVAIGVPSDEMRDRFTRVLKGHIAIATARFPAGTSGGQLDGFARRALWDAGLDYDHGTGHGVGCFLGVHEGPQRISKRGGDVALRPGMVVSNEPGYYKSGAWGIRIENLELVRTLAPVKDGEQELLGFEALTLAPIDRTLIDISILTKDEIAWCDAYHARVKQTIGPLVDEETNAWLEEVTRPLSG